MATLSFDILDAAALLLEDYELPQSGGVIRAKDSWVTVTALDNNNNVWIKMSPLDNVAYRIDVNKLKFIVHGHCVKW